MSFTLYHLRLDKADFKPVASVAVNDNLRIQRAWPNYDLMMEFIKAVGGNSNWHLRKVYADRAAVSDLKNRMNDVSARLYLFKEGSETVGFCQVLNSKDLEDHFPDQKNTAEIYKVGLYPRHVGGRKGAVFVSMVLDDLFQAFDKVYLNTRSSNAVKSLPFYQRLGFKVLEQEEKPDDICVSGFDNRFEVS
jgi:ribosomal protein S18 acetylase RimI-like enzyme